MVAFTFARIWWDYPFTPLNSDQETRKVKIPKGIGLKGVAFLLEREGIVAHPYFFILMCKLNRRLPVIKAGEYELRASNSPLEIYKILEKGEYRKHYITVPEGYTLNQIAKLLVKEQLVNQHKFLKLAHDREFIKSLKVDAPSLEGYLFPDSYEFTKDNGEVYILKKMVNRFHEVFNDYFKMRATELKLSVHKVVTLASLIEKEAKTAEEKGLVSAVYYNRLKKNMLLQCDPTIIYVIEDSFDGVLKNSYLDINSPYNTYKYPGLPPGPIANPGKESILAALYPAKEKFLYFVSTNDGYHKFSTTYGEHLTAVKEFRERREMLKRQSDQIQPQEEVRSLNQ